MLTVLPHCLLHGHGTAKANHGKKVYRRCHIFDSGIRRLFCRFWQTDNQRFHLRIFHVLPGDSFFRRVYLRAHLLARWRTKMTSEESRELMELKRLVQDIHKRLFYDNGSPSFQTRLSNHSQQIKLIYWVGGTAVAALVGAVVRLWFQG